MSKCYNVSIYSCSLDETLTPAWLALLMDPLLHSTLCGLFTRAAFLLRLLKTCDNVQHLCDPSSLHMCLQEVCSLLSQNGVHFPSAVTAAVAGELPLWRNGGPFSVHSMSKAFWPMKPGMKLPVDISGMLMPSKCAALVFRECCNCWSCSTPALGRLGYVRVQWLQSVVSIIILPIQNRDPLGIRCHVHMRRAV